MKKIFKLVKTSLLIAVYCFALSIVTAPQHFSDLNYKKFDTEFDLNAKQVVAFSFLTQQAGFVWSTGQSLLTSNLSNSLLSWGAILNSIELINQSAFSQYQYYLRNKLINSRKSDLIYPFHYFW